MQNSDLQPEPAYFDSNDTGNTQTFLAPLYLAPLWYLFNWDLGIPSWDSLLILAHNSIIFIVSRSQVCKTVGSQRLSVAIIYHKDNPRCSFICLNLISASSVFKYPLYYRFICETALNHVNCIHYMLPRIFGFRISLNWELLY